MASGGKGSKGSGGKELNECLTICVLETARKIAPCIVFIDEIDSLASNRTHSLYTTEAANQTLNQLLTELDG